MTGKSSSQEFLTSRQVADLFQVTPMTVRRWGNAGTLESTTTAGGHRRFSLEHVYRFARHKGIDLDAANDKLIHVLIICNEQQQNQLLGTILTEVNSNYQCHFASSNFDAGLSLYRHKPELVFIDLEESKLEVELICQSIKNKTELENIKLIALGEYNRKKNGSKAALEFDLQLAKPVQTELLSSYLSSLAQG